MPLFFDIILTSMGLHRSVLGDSRSYKLFDHSINLVDLCFVPLKVQKSSYYLLISLGAPVFGQKNGNSLDYSLICNTGNNNNTGLQPTLPVRGSSMTVCSTLIPHYVNI
jgi:hypothetical protein